MHGLGGSSGTHLPALSKALANPQNCKKIKKQKKRVRNGIADI